MYAFNILLHQEIVVSILHGCVIVTCMFLYGHETCCHMQSFYKTIAKLYDPYKNICKIVIGGGQIVKPALFLYIL